MTNNKYISTVPFSGLYNWSVQYLNDSKISFNKKYPMMCIGEFLKRNKTAVTIEDGVKYKRVTIRVRNGGVVTRDEVIGKDIKTKKQFLVSEGQFIISKIDARNGAMGIIPAELDGAVVTQDFLPYDINTTKVNPQYFVLVCTTKQFIAFCQSCSSGTTNRQRVDEAQFLNIKIPVPSLAEQNKLVEEYNKQMIVADKLVQEYQTIDNNILQYFDNAIGLKQSARKTKLLSLMRYADISNRWDSFAVTNKLSASVPIYPLGNFIKDIATGTTPPTAKKEYFNGDIKFYTPSDIRGNMYLTNTERTLTQKAIDDKKARVFHKGDILFVGIGSTVGKVGIVNDEMVSSNQQITGITLNNKEIYPEYAFYYLHYHKELTTAEHSKTTLPIVNQEKIANIPIPVPTMAQQVEMVEHMSKMRNKIEQLYIRSIKYRTNALNAFETQIFE